MAGGYSVLQQKYLAPWWFPGTVWCVPGCSKQCSRLFTHRALSGKAKLPFAFSAMYAFGLVGLELLWLQLSPSAANFY